MNTNTFDTVMTDLAYKIANLDHLERQGQNVTAERRLLVGAVVDLAAWQLTQLTATGCGGGEEECPSCSEIVAADEGEFECACGAIWQH